MTGVQTCALPICDSDVCSSDLGVGRGRALGCGEVKFSGQVLPTHKKITYHIHIKRLIMRQLILGIADATASVDGREIYNGTDLKVGLFTSTDSF